MQIEQLLQANIAAKVELVVDGVVLAFSYEWERAGQWVVYRARTNDSRFLYQGANGAAALECLIRMAGIVRQLEFARAQGWQEAAPVYVAVGYSDTAGKMILGIMPTQQEADAVARRWVEQCEWVDVEQWRMGEELVIEPDAPIL